MHAAVGQDVAQAIALAGTLRRQAQQRKVGGTAADIDDQGEGFALQRAFKIKRRGNWLVLELDMLQPHRARNISQHVLRQLIGHRVVIDKMHRAAQHRVLEPTAGGLLGAAFKLADKVTENGAERQALALDLGLQIHQAGTNMLLSERIRRPS